MTVRGVAISEKGLYLSPRWVAIIAAVVVLIVVALLVAVVTNSSPTLASQTVPPVASASVIQEQAPASASAPAIAPPTRPANQAQTGNLEVTVNQVLSSWNGLPEIEPGFKYIVIDITFRNINDKYFALSTGDSMGITDDKGAIKTASWGTMVEGPNLYFIEVGKQARSIGAFKILKERSASEFFLSYRENGRNEHISILLPPITK